MDSQEFLHDFTVLYDENSTDSCQCAEFLCNLFEENGRKGYLFVRDCLPGSDILSETYQSIRTSRHIIALMTPDFLRSGWERYKQKAAFMKLTMKGQHSDNGGRTRLVPVAYHMTRAEVRKEPELEHLCVSHVLQLQDDYRNDEEGKRALLRTIQKREPIPVDITISPESGERRHSRERIPIYDPQAGRPVHENGLVTSSNNLIYTEREFGSIPMDGTVVCQPEESYEPVDCQKVEHFEPVDCQLAERSSGDGFTVMDAENAFERDKHAWNSPKLADADCLHDLKSIEVKGENSLSEPKMTTAHADVWPSIVTVTKISIGVGVLAIAAAFIYRH